MAVRRQQFNVSAATGCVRDPGHNKLLNLALIPFSICQVGITLHQTFFFPLVLTINLVFWIFKFQDNDSCLYVYNSALQIGILTSYVIFTWDRYSKI